MLIVLRQQRRDLSHRADTCNHARQAVPKPLMHKACTTGYRAAFEKARSLTDETILKVKAPLDLPRIESLGPIMLVRSHDAKLVCRNRRVHPPGAVCGGREDRDGGG